MSDTKHENRAHALLSPSGAERWMNCTPSARAEEPMENVPSVYALEGTLAHELAETELRNFFGLITTDQYNAKIKEIQADEHYSEEMPEEVDKYVQYVIEQHAERLSDSESVEISIEEKVNLTAYIEEGFGSNDFVIISDDMLEVIDLKYGRGVGVSAVENPQLMLYGLGSVYKNKFSYDIKRVKLTIVQPRTNNISSYIMLVEDLEAWAEIVKEKAVLAYAGEGEFKPGHWCKFCKFKPKCKAIYDENLVIMQNDFKSPTEMTEEEILKVYEKSEEISSWLNSIQAYILAKLMKNEKVGNYKLVKGNGRRKFTNPEAIIKELDKHYNEDEYMGEPKLLGITAIEKLVGKEKFNTMLGAYVAKSEGGPTVARLDDKRSDFFSKPENDFL